jgi:hypothetical protein
MNISKSMNGSGRWIALAGLIISSGYGWACYVTSSCTCAVIGSCYSQKILPTCQVPTCLIADTSATVWTVCSGNGTYTGRQITYPDDRCTPLACRLYDNCAHQYVGLSGDDCSFAVVHYEGVGSGCH